MLMLIVGWAVKARSYIRLRWREWRAPDGQTYRNKARRIRRRWARTSKRILRAAWLGCRSNYVTASPGKEGAVGTDGKDKAAKRPNKDKGGIEGKYVSNGRAWKRLGTRRVATGRTGKLGGTGRGSREVKGNRFAPLMEARVAGREFQDTARGRRKRKPRRWGLVLPLVPLLGYYGGPSGWRASQLSGQGTCSNGCETARMGKSSMGERTETITLASPSHLWPLGSEILQEVGEEYRKWQGEVRGKEEAWRANPGRSLVLDGMRGG